MDARRPDAHLRRRGGRRASAVIVDASGRSPAEMSFSSAGETYLLDVSPTGQILAARDDLHNTIRGRAPGEASDANTRGSTFRSARSFRRTGGSWCSRTSMTPPEPTTRSRCAATTDRRRASRTRQGARPLAGREMGALAHPVRSSDAALPHRRRIAGQTRAGTNRQLRLRRPMVYRRQARAGVWHGQVGRVAVLPAVDRWGAPAPITPDGSDAAMLAHDDRTLIYRDGAGGYWLTSLGGSAAPKRAPGLATADQPVGFSQDNRSMFVRVAPVFRCTSIASTSRPGRARRPPTSPRRTAQASSRSAWISGSTTGGCTRIGC